MPKLYVPSAILPALSFAYKLYANHLPLRYKKISEYLSNHISEYPDVVSTPNCEIGVGRSTITPKQFDYANKEHLKIVEDYLGDKARLHCLILPQEYILLPALVNCCGTALKFGRDRSSQLFLYKTDGVVQARAYHLHCSKCSMSYYHGFSELPGAGQDGNNKRTYDISTLESDSIMISRETAFDTKYLREICVDIELGRSFEDVTERYNRLYGVITAERGVLHKQRLEDAFFLIKLLQYFRRSLTVEVSKTSNRLDIDDLCDEAVAEVFTTENEWKSHQCDVKGCKEGFVMCDGNEKLRRRICSAPRETLKLSNSMPKIVNKCGNSPVFGGANQQASKFCKQHQDLASDEPPAKRIVLTINVPDQIVSSRIVDISKTLPSNDDTTMHIACKKVTNVKHFHDKTAGIMAIVRPCGMILDCRELYTCESSSQLFIQLLKLVDEPNTRIAFVGYDRACEFVPFLRNLQKKGNVGADKLLEKSYLVDNFHIAGHTSEACNPESDLCEFHHGLPKFSSIANANTECAEQTFSWLKRYKSIVKYMTAQRFRFFMYSVIKAHNNVIEQRKV